MQRPEDELLPRIPGFALSTSHRASGWLGKPHASRKHTKPARGLAALHVMPSAFSNRMSAPGHCSRAKRPNLDLLTLMGESKWSASWETVLITFLAWRFTLPRIPYGVPIPIRAPILESVLPILKRTAYDQRHPTGAWPWKFVDDMIGKDRQQSGFHSGAGMCQISSYPMHAGLGPNPLGFFRGVRKNFFAA